MWRGRANSFEDIFVKEGWRITQDGPILRLTPPTAQPKRRGYTYDICLLDGPQDPLLPNSQAPGPKSDQAVTQ